VRKNEPQSTYFNYANFKKYRNKSNPLHHIDNKNAAPKTLDKSIANPTLIFLYCLSNTVRYWQCVQKKYP